MGIVDSLTALYGDKLTTVGWFIVLVEVGELYRMMDPHPGDLMKWKFIIHTPREYGIDD